MASTSCFRGKAISGPSYRGSLAEADANSLPQQALGVGFGAEEVGLKDGSDAAGKTGGEALSHGDGRLGVGGALHVDADEGVGGRGVLDHLGDDALGESGVEVHADLRELDADVRVEFLFVNCVEELVVDGPAEVRAWASVVTLSPRESSVAAIPS